MVQDACRHTKLVDITSGHGMLVLHNAMLKNTLRICEDNLSRPMNEEAQTAGITLWVGSVGS